MNYWIHQIGILSFFWGILFIPVGFLVGWREPLPQMALTISILGSLILFFMMGEFEPLFKRLRQNYKNVQENEN